VIARRISFGTRTDEGSRFYAAGLSIIDTCRKRGVEPWAYACPSVPTMLRQATPGSLPLRAEVKASNGYAPSRLRKDTCRQR